MSEELIPTNRQEKIMSDTIRALNGDDVTDALVPGWDDEYFLDNILKAAQGEDPLYNLEPRWHHQKFYKAIAEAIAESGGGGAKLLATKEFDVSTTSTSSIDIPNSEIVVPFADPYKKILLVTVRDKNGKRASSFFGSDTRWAQPKNGSVSNDYRWSMTYGCDVNSDVVSLSTSPNGVYPKSPVVFSNDQAVIKMVAKYNSSYSKTIDGTYVVSVYELEYPYGVSPFE